MDEKVKQRGSWLPCIWKMPGFGLFEKCYVARKQFYTHGGSDCILLSYVNLFMLFSCISLVWPSNSCELPFHDTLGSCYTKAFDFM